MRIRVGMTVHYVSRGSKDGFYKPKCRAAQVTNRDYPLNAPDGRVALDLCVLNPEGMFFNRGVLSGTVDQPGSWHDMEMCDE